MPNLWNVRLMDEPDTALVLDSLNADAVLKSTILDERPSAIAGISRFGFEGSYSIDDTIDWGHKRAAREALLKLTAREERVLRLRLGFGCEPHAHTEIADQFGVSVERIRQIEAKALRKLKHPDRSRHLRSLLDQ